MTVKRWRTLLVWLHALTSFAWMAQAMALVALVGTAVATHDAAIRVAAADMATMLDMRLLGLLANASAFTGIVLAASTPWGFFRHWWVIAKFAITLSQLYVGIFVLSGGLVDARAAAAAGQPVSLWPNGIGGALMVAAIGFQGWLSLAKPWAKTRWATTRGPRKLPTAPAWIFAAAVAAVAVDAVLTQVSGYPAPAAEIVLLVTVLARRGHILAPRSVRAVSATSS